MACLVNIRKWGNSIGIVLPKDVVVSKGLKPKDKVLIEIGKQADISNLFGTQKRRMSGQEFKDMVRKGW